MNTQTTRLCEKLIVRLQDALFSSEPCKKHPDWCLSPSAVNDLKRRHRTITEKSLLEQAIRYMKLLELPEECNKELA